VTLSFYRAIFPNQATPTLIPAASVLSGDEDKRVNPLRR
jgi:hypothetical protein